jgi:hypothetical protein
LIVPAKGQPHLEVRSLTFYDSRKAGFREKPHADGIRLFLSLLIAAQWPVLVLVIVPARETVEGALGG